MKRLGIGEMEVGTGREGDDYRERRSGNSKRRGWK